MALFDWCAQCRVKFVFLELKVYNRKDSHGWIANIILLRLWSSPYDVARRCFTLLALKNFLVNAKRGGRHLVDIISDFSWTKGVTSRGHFWWLLVDTFVHEKSSFGVHFRGHFLGEFSWIFWVNFQGHLIVMISSSNKLTKT